MDLEPFSAWRARRTIQGDIEADRLEYFIENIPVMAAIRRAEILKEAEHANSPG